MVPIAYAEASRDALRLAGYAVEWREYDVAHSVSSDEIDDIGDWLRRIL
jgi:phospholipase/carboxylesterase